MKVVIYPEPGQEGDKFYQPLPNDWHLGNFHLRDELTKRGHETAIWPCEVDKQKDIGLCFDFPRYPCNIPDRAMCVMLEPPVVFPREYDKINGLPFKRILTFARDFCDHVRVFWEPYPIVPYTGPLADKRDKYICAVSGNKDFPSVNINGRVYESMYAARRLAYAGMGKDLDLYGQGWTEPAMINAVNYKGTIPGHKVPVMSQYKFAIVFENVYCEGYASEKQYDAHAAGVIPIIRGWQPDYPWEYAFTKNWVMRVVDHLEGIA